MCLVSAFGSCEVLGRQNRVTAFITWTPPESLHTHHINTHSHQRFTPLDGSNMAETLDRTGRQAGKPIELAIPLPNAPQTKIYIRLTISATSILLLLTTVFGGENAIKPTLGSFVYALPDVSIFSGRRGPMIFKS